MHSTFTQAAINRTGYAVGAIGSGAAILGVFQAPYPTPTAAECATAQQNHAVRYPISYPHTVADMCSMREYLGYIGLSVSGYSVILYSLS
jgi:hypothetical protein